MALKIKSKRSFINHKLSFFAEFCLVLPALMTFLNTPLDTFGLVYVITNTSIRGGHQIRIQRIEENR